MPTAPRLLAWCLALAALAMSAGGLLLDRIASEQHVPGSGSLWLYPFFIVAVSAPAAVGALITVRQARNVGA